MWILLRSLLLLGGIFFALMGIGFLINPISSAADFGLAPQGTLGLASIRADMTAFFMVAGGCLIWGAWARKGDPLLVTAALMAFALLGRIVTLMANGPHDDWWVPMVVEAITLVLALMGSRVLPHTALTPETDTN